MLMEQCKAWRLSTCATCLLWPPFFPTWGSGRAWTGSRTGQAWMCTLQGVSRQNTAVAIQFRGCSARGILRLSGGSLPPISYPGTPGTLVQDLQYTWPLFSGLGQWGCGRGRCQVGLLCSQLGHSLWVL